MRGGGVTAGLAHHDAYGRRVRLRADRAFRDGVADRYATDRIHLLFNKAGIGGGGSLIVNRCEEWERTFNVCWGSVDDGTRALLPLLLKAEEGHIDELVRRSLERA